MDEDLIQTRDGEKRQGKDDKAKGGKELPKADTSKKPETPSKPGSSPIQPVNPGSSSDPVKPEKTAEETSSNSAENDKKIDDGAKELKEEVEKMEWKKHNFEEFNAASVKGITGILQS